MQAPSIAIDPNGGMTILERIADGEKSAIEECIRAYGKLIWTIARKHTNNIEDVEDVVQEIFTSIWINAYRFNAEKSPEPAFICLLAQRKAIDFFRRHRRQNSETELSEFEKSPDAKAGDYRNILLGLDLKEIKNALGKLPAVENEMIKLSIFGGNSHNEIAEKLDLPLGTVKSKIRRGITKVKKSVGESFLTNLRNAYYG